MSMNGNFETPHFNPKTEIQSILHGLLTINKKKSVKQNNSIPALQSLSNLQKECLISRELSSIISNHPPSCRRLQRIEAKIKKIDGQILHQFQPLLSLTRKGEDRSQFRPIEEPIKRGSAKSAEETFYSLFPIDIQALILEDLFRSSQTKDITNALALTRQLIKKDPEEGYAILAQCINKNHLKLDSPGLKLSPLELNKIAPHLIHLDFGEAFDFSSWNEHQIIDLISRCENLEVLTIHTDKLSKLPIIATQLKKLDCSKCYNLTALPDNMKVLEHLNCSNCTHLNKLPEAMDKLLILCCSGSSRLEYLPSGMVALKQLNCNQCRIEELPEEMRTLEKLSCIRCTSLSYLPSNMPYVKNLNCSDCTLLSGLPDSMVALEVLNCISCTSITGLPEEMASLNHLNCSDCSSLFSLPASINNIQKLDCSGCPIDALPTSMGSLEFLDCKNCPIEELPDEMRLLKKLNCSFCPLNSLPNGMSSLEELRCWDCLELNYLPDDMKNLKRLYCMNCTELKSLPTGMRSLEKINYRNCTTLLGLLIDLPQEIALVR